MTTDLLLSRNERGHVNLFYIETSQFILYTNKQANTKTPNPNKTLSATVLKDNK